MSSLKGKTLFVSSAIQSFITHKVKTYVMPLETAADDFRNFLAELAEGQGTLRDDE